jgi:hypothetical protein
MSDFLFFVIPIALFVIVMTLAYWADQDQKRGIG